MEAALANVSLRCHLCANAAWMQAENLLKKKKKRDEITTETQKYLSPGPLQGISVGPWTHDAEVCIDWIAEPPSQKIHKKQKQTKRGQQ